MAASAAVHVIQDVDSASAMLHPLRLKILEELREPDSAAGLARRLGLPRQQLNYHVRQLEGDGLVEAVGERKKRNCTERLVRAVARSYLISPETLGQLALEPKRVQDHASSAYLVAVAAQTIREVAAQRDRAHRTNKRLPTLTLQADVRFATPERQHAFAKELAQTVAEVVAKYHDEETPGGRRFRLTVGAYPAPPESDHNTEPREEES
jgi:DNA-binding transcriptional ArsR family regulator